MSRQRLFGLFFLRVGRSARGSEKGKKKSLAGFVFSPLGVGVPRNVWTPRYPSTVPPELPRRQPAMMSAAAASAAARTASGPRLLSPTDGVFEQDVVATILLIGDATIDKMGLAERLTAQPHVEARLASALPLAADGDRPAVDFVCFLVGAIENEHAVHAI